MTQAVVDPIPPNPPAPPEPLAAEPPSAQARPQVKQKRRMMKESGELARWERARAETPEDDVVIYPPFPMSTEELRRLTHSAEQFDKRLELERRAEQERWNE